MVDGCLLGGCWVVVGWLMGGRCIDGEINK